MSKNVISPLKQAVMVYLVISGSLFTGCALKPENKTELDHCAVVATIQQTNEGPVTVLDLSLFKDSVILPVSQIIEELEIVRLENSDEALTGTDGHITVSDNYIGIYSFQTGYKLYTRKGKYLTTVSSRGQGPHEYYIAIYDSFIDEEQGLIYLMSFRANQIWVFDLEGNPHSSIPLPYPVHKGRFRINKEKKWVEMVVLPFEDTPSVAWVQDLNGNIIHEIPAGHFVISPSDYSNEVNSYQSTSEFDFSTLYWGPRVDTLYHYKPDLNLLVPRFTTRFSEEVHRHYFTEIPGYYLLDLVVHHNMGESHDTPSYVVDKKSLKGAKVRWVFNELGNIAGEKLTLYTRGYLVNNMFPHTLRKQLAMKLRNPERLSPEQITRMKELYLSIGEEDNNILLLGKLRENGE